ncbi:hypothetical protein BN946_scf184813.g14 [Trametes cinnabarina]|uniref:DH domain-containing protein n=1 Tax=Pycnoporus cinnabarinus TaxID=5643 RepID=A0A060SWZ4_PYCCI|nr:hypothetical protein BN946_scf184813.g14 [Trametes cinnabarina]
MSSLSENTTRTRNETESVAASEPRSRRVDVGDSELPEDVRLSTFSVASSSASTSSSPPSTTAVPPAIPPRSPLRPTAKPHSRPSISSLTAATLTEEPEGNEMSLSHSRSLGSFFDHMPASATSSTRPITPDKPLPLTPQPSEPMPLSALDPGEDDEGTLVPSASARSSLTAVTSKRTHALLELLSSERAYASDLALIRDIHVPLALGQPAPFHATPATPPGSSASSSRTLSTASDLSAASSSSAEGPPMSSEDVKIIFTNVEELAFFADSFTEALEDALGDVLEGGSGQDRVGKLFLETIPRLEPLYRTYITKHPTALEHLNKLPQTPALTAYLAQTRTLASSLSHAWDLPSLLIKPVQRLLKYPLLLATIIEETPESHADKANLRLAREKLEEVARAVNEGRRRREVVKEVLSATGVNGSPLKNGEVKAKKKGLNVGVAASVSLGRMKSLRSAAYKAKEGAEANQEAEQVKRMGEMLKEYEDFLHRFAKETARWVESAREVTIALNEWAQSFGRVIWMGSDTRSEAFDAFLDLIGNDLLPICDDAKEYLEDKVHPTLTQFLQTTHPPLRLLEAMRTLEPLHYGLLNLNISKSRPPPQLLEASQSYVALRAQLFAELPEYLKLMDRGIAMCIMQFATLQEAFFYRMREKWGLLWDALKVDEEANQGAAETLRVWWSRFADVEIAIQTLNIVRPPEKRSLDKGRRKSGGKGSSLHENEAAQSMAVSSVLSALDPLKIPAGVAPAPPPPYTTSPAPASAKAQSVHSIEVENLISDRKSIESLPAKKAGKGRRSSSRGHSMGSSTLYEEGGYTYVVPQMDALSSSNAGSKPSYSRTKSMPLSSSATPLKKTQSQGRLLEVPDDVSPSSSNPSLRSVAGSLQEDARGRPTRKPSFRRRLTDSFRSGASTESRHRRSPSLPSTVGYTTPSPSPNKAAFAPPGSTTSTRKRTSGGPIPALYQCRVIHPCSPPAGVSYRGLPFFTLHVDDVFDILKEAGHPSTHRDLPLYVDDGEDCLLLARDDAGNVGWVLASFLLPVD